MRLLSAVLLFVSDTMIMFVFISCMYSNTDGLNFESSNTRLLYLLTDFAPLVKKNKTFEHIDTKSLHQLFAVVSELYIIHMYLFIKIFSQSQRK